MARDGAMISRLNTPNTHEDENGTQQPVDCELDNRLQFGPRIGLAGNRRGERFYRDQTLVCLFERRGVEAFHSAEIMEGAMTISGASALAA